jgi:hypothetical protein
MAIRRRFHKYTDGPVALEARDLEREVAQQLGAVGRVITSGWNCTLRSWRPCRYRLQGFAQRKPANRAKSVSVE